MTRRVDPGAWWVYGILDLGYVAASDAAPVAARLIDGGIDVIQLRAKGADGAAIERVGIMLRELTSARGVPLILNDDAALAVRVDADGVHLGQEDMPVADARGIVGERRVIGLSTHGVAQARAARGGGADYIGYGPIFATATKPDRAPIGLDGIVAAQAASGLPTFCIGGIHPGNLPAVLAAGARRVAMVSAFLLAPDIAAAVRAARDAIERQRPAEGSGGPC